MDPTSLLMIVAAGAAFYFLIIRPGRKRQQQQQALIAALAPGAEIMTNAGIFGTVAAVTDEQISIEVSPGVFLRVLPAAVSRVVEPAPAEGVQGPGSEPTPGLPGNEPPVD